MAYYPSYGTRQQRIRGEDTMIQVIIFLIRALLAAVLVAAGAAKLADILGFANTLLELGVPDRETHLVRMLALAIPLLEIGLGLALVSYLWPTIISAVVLILMCGFSIVVLVALRKAPHVACRCFGSLSSSQFSGKGLFRSLFLALLAGVVFWKGGTYYVPQFNQSSDIVLLIVVGYLIFAVSVAQAARTIADVKERISL
jgi:uncharacterized membrane protein YphA (DoxX/SURF4 family)